MFAHDAGCVALVCQTVIQIVAAHPTATNGCCVFEFQHPMFFAILFPIARITPLVCFGINQLIADIGIVLDAVTPLAPFLNASPRTD